MIVAHMMETHFRELSPGTKLTVLGYRTWGGMGILGGPRDFKGA